VNRLSIFKFLFIEFFTRCVSRKLVFSSVFAQSWNYLIINIKWLMHICVPILSANFHLLILLLDAVCFFVASLAINCWLPSLKLFLHWDLNTIINAVLLAGCSKIWLIVSFFLLVYHKISNAIHYWSYLIALLGCMLHNPRAWVVHRLNCYVIEVVLAFSKLLNVSFTPSWLLLYELLRHLLLHMLLLWKWGLIWVCMHHRGILYLLHLNLKSFRLIEVITLNRYLLLCV